MARHEGDFQAASETSLDLGELLEAIAGAAFADDRARQEAIACYLSASEGWRDAAQRLRGAFADAAARSGLTTDKDQ